MSVLCSISAGKATSPSTTQPPRGLPELKKTFNITTTKVSPNDDGSNPRRNYSNSRLIAVTSLSPSASCLKETPPLSAVPTATPTSASSNSSMIDFEQDPPAPYSDNIAGLVFAEEQGSFLVGAAAALSSETGTVGFIGGVCCFGLIEKFEAGFRAGALHVNPDIEIISQYITEFPDFDGFNAPDRGRENSAGHLRRGCRCDLPRSGWHRCRVVHRGQRTQRSYRLKGLGIGVDSDQYYTVDADVQEYVLSSMLKRVDTAIFEIIKAHLEGTFGPGENPL